MTKRLFFDSSPNRFLSESECNALVDQIYRMGRGGGTTDVGISSRWMGITRWARNQVTLSQDIRNTTLRITRSIRGASGSRVVNQLDTPALEWAVRQAERYVKRNREVLMSDAYKRTPEDVPLRPDVWSDATYNLTTMAQTSAMESLVAECKRAGMQSAGTIKVVALGTGAFNTLGHKLYYPVTWVNYSVTVRSPSGSGSGWAGIDHHDWTKIDAAAITARALDKCLQSQNPVRVEPGRYTAILEPQAVADFVGKVLGNTIWMDRQYNEYCEEGRIFHDSCEQDPENPLKPIGHSKIGQRVIDERLSISESPTDPELSYPPFNLFGGPRNVYRPVEWFKNGILTNLYYDRRYAVEEMFRDTALPASGGFRISVSGPSASTEEMIATTQRGVLVTRFSSIVLVDTPSATFAGYTRDGLWLIERGKITKPINNFRFVESPWTVLNRVEQIGEPTRVFRELIQGPVIAPALKIRDFSFVQLSDAV